MHFVFLVKYRHINILQLDSQVFMIQKYIIKFRDAFVHLSISITAKLNGQSDNGQYVMHWGMGLTWRIGCPLA